MKETIIAVSWQSVAPRGKYWYYKMSVVVSVVCLPPDCQLVPGVYYWPSDLVLLWSHLITIITISSPPLWPGITSPGQLETTSSETAAPTARLLVPTIPPPHNKKGNNSKPVDPASHPCLAGKLWRNVGELFWLDCGSGWDYPLGRRDRISLLYHYQHLSLIEPTCLPSAHQPHQSHHQVWYLHIYYSILIISQKIFANDKQPVSSMVGWAGLDLAGSL